MTSAYPAPVAELIPQARQLAAELGRTPSRNQLMARLHVGAGKANAVLAALADPDVDADPDQAAESDPGSARRLHSVPDTTPPAPDLPDAPVPSTPDTDAPIDLPAVPVSAVTDPDAPADMPARRPGAWLRRIRDTAPTSTTPARAVRAWPVILLAAPAFVAIWSGWVGLGALTGFGPVHPLPGIASGFTLNSAITLPVGVETYAAYALRVWLAGTGTGQARRFAKWSAIGSLVLGALGQVAYHLMTARHLTAAPWPITTAVACLPVLVLGFGAALAHLQRHTDGRHTA